MSQDAVIVDGLEVPCIVGVRPAERTREQPLLVRLALKADLGIAGRSGRIADTCDYAQVCQHVQDLLQFRRYRLLETACEELSAALLALHPLASGIEVALSKPQALSDFRARPTVACTRTRLDFPVRIEPTRFGHVEVLLETREAGLYLLHVAPAREIPRHLHRTMRELEWLVEGELQCNTEPVVRGRARAWSHDEPHCYVNPSAHMATLFCCDTPPFDPRDEIEVPT